MAVVNNFAYIEKTLAGVLDKVYARESITDALIGGNKDVKLEFVDAKTVKIFKMETTGLTDYQRGGHGSSNTRGAVRSSFETFTLRFERYAEIPVDQLDNLDDAETVFGHLAVEFNRLHVIPEMDALRLSELAGMTSAVLGNRVSENIGANTIISKFNTAFEWFDNQQVPASEQVIYCSPAVMNLIRGTTELYRKLSQSEYQGNVSFAIQKYEGREIVVVPESRFYTNCKLNAGGGFYPDTGAKKINFMIVSKSAPVIVTKLAKTKVFNSIDENGSYLGFSGYLFTNLYYHDIFVPENKRVGIYASVSTNDATGVGAGVILNAVAGDSAGETKITEIYSQPAGQIYDKIYRYKDANAPAIGSTAGVGLDWLEITVGGSWTPDNTHNYIVMAFDGKVVAVSKDWTNTLPVHA